MNNRQTQQGDVLFTRVDSFPKEAKEIQRENGTLILVRGETTGHNHAITKEGAKAFKLTKSDGTTDLFLVVEAPEITIDHPEHSSQLKETGVYKIGRVQEFDYLSAMPRQVKD